jgi:hypothetical protein
MFGTQQLQERAALGERAVGDEAEEDLIARVASG